MYILKKYLKNNEGINKYIFPETVSSLLKIKSSNVNLYGTKLFGLSIEELLERQRILKENGTKKKILSHSHLNNSVIIKYEFFLIHFFFYNSNITSEDENNKKSEKEKSLKKESKNNNDNQETEENTETEEKTKIWRNEVSNYENKPISMESIFQSEYKIENVPTEIQQFVKYLKQDKGLYSLLHIIYYIVKIICNKFYLTIYIVL